jgi:nicotinamidase-related amidase
MSAELSQVLTVPVDARPFEFALQPAHAALVIIDMQRDFIEPGGFGASLGNDVSLLSAAIGPTRTLLQAWRALGWPVVHTREAHQADLSDCPPAKRVRGNPSLRIGDMGPMGRLLVRGEPGSQIVPTLAPQPGELVIDKPGKGAFYGTPLGNELHGMGVTQLVFAGVTTEVCVQTTMREANDRGFDCLLVEEATASYFPEFKAATIEMIVAQGGIVGWATPLAALMDALQPALRLAIASAA